MKERVIWEAYLAASQSHMENRRLQYERLVTDIRLGRLERALARCHRYLERLTQQAKAGRERAALVKELELSTPASRLTWIALHNQHSVLYYPDSFARVDRAVIASLPSATKMLLVNQLRSIRRSAWRRLCAELVASPSAGRPGRAQRR